MSCGEGQVSTFAFSATGKSGDLTPKAPKWRLDPKVSNIPGIGAPMKEDDNLQEEARLLYVAMPRATQELVMTHGEASVLGEKMGKAMGVLEAM